MEKKSFIVQVPDEPGALHKAAWISKQYQANIHRIHYNRKIDVNTVFLISPPRMKTTKRFSMI